LQSDERLIVLVRKGNHGAFEALVGRYQARLLAFCRHMLGSREDAEDVLQEVFAAAFNAILADDRPINVRPWLYRIARNRSLNHLRRHQAIGVDSMDVHLSEGGLTTADKVHKREEFRALIGDVQELPETQRTALLLREIDALSYDQIAETMETTVPSVKSLLVRARVALAEMSEARQLTCDEVREELGEVAEGLKRTTPPVRRHLRTCDRCTTFRKQLRDTNKALASVMPVAPLLLLKKLLLAHLGTTASAGGGAAAGAAGGAAAGGAVSAGVGTVASKAAAGLAAAAIVSVGAVEVKRAQVPDTRQRAAIPAQVAPAVAAAPAAAALPEPDAVAGTPQPTTTVADAPKAGGGREARRGRGDEQDDRARARQGRARPGGRRRGRQGEGRRRRRAGRQAHRRREPCRPSGRRSRASTPASCRPSRTTSRDRRNRGPGRGRAIGRQGEAQQQQAPPAQPQPAQQRPAQQPVPPAAAARLSSSPPSSPRHPPSRSPRRCRARSATSSRPESRGAATRRRVAPMEITFDDFLRSTCASGASSRSRSSPRPASRRGSSASTSATRSA
jgi:RNA polymerase sigma factor (sigma-70 family)